MAKLTGPLSFTGSLGDFSAYKMRGSDKIILRRKWGPSKKDIQTKSQYDVTRRNNCEFAARSRGASAVQQILHGLKPVGDYNLAGPLNGFMSTIVKLDTEGEYGRRALRLSRQPRLLEGLNLSKHHPLDNVLCTPVEAALWRDERRAQVALPEFVPGVNFFPPGRYPFFRVVAVLGVVPDLIYDDVLGYAPEAAFRPLFPVRAETPWFPVKSGAPATVLNLALEGNPGVASFSLLLAVGISFGTVGAAGSAEPLRYAGSGKIVAME